MNDNLDEYLKVEKSELEEKEQTGTAKRIGNYLDSLDMLKTFVLTVYGWIYSYLISPFTSLVNNRITRVVWNWYIDKWMRFVRKDGETSKKRASIFIFSTLLALWFSYVMFFLIKDVVFYMATYELNETVYLSNAQEIDPENNVHSVQGCMVKMEANGNFSCSTEDSLYFRIHSTLFNQIWYFAKEGSFMYPDYVAATIAPGWQKCVISSYGFRAKLFVRRLDIYPTLLSVNCTKI